MTKNALRLRALAIVMALLVMPLAALAQEAGAAAPLYVNAGEALSIHESADAGTGALRTLQPGEAFEMVSSQAGWASIRVLTESGEMLSGWVTSEGLRPKTAEDGYSAAVIAPENPDDRPILRTGPRSGADSLGRYFPGVVARVLAQPENGWARLAIGSLEGYMRESDLAFDPPPGSVADLLPRVAVAYQDGPSLTMRAAQSFQSEKVTAYRNGTQVRLMGFTDDFGHVLAPDGRVGFMMAWGLDPQPFAALPAPPALLPGATAQPAATTAPIIPPDSFDYITRIDNTGGQGAHLRQRASTASDTQGLYPNGTQVWVLRYGEWWTQVWVDGKTGWMMTKLLEGQGAENPQ
ncbi:MAG: SH3 domain-containing protein [Eubacteriales bacterium]|nr:SH3 domain-containing protein [Eubacteriales bacterium]